MRRRGQAIARASLGAAALASLGACKQPAGPRSLVGEFAAPGTFALAADTITVWRRQLQPDGSWLFTASTITPGGQVVTRQDTERAPAPGAPTDFVSTEAVVIASFTLPHRDFERLRERAALLRPGALGPVEPARGYGGEALPAGCALAADEPRVSGINFLNDGNWGAFVLQPGCASPGAARARLVMDEIFALLARGRSAPVPAPQ